MNRDLLLCKAKRIDNDEWIAGYYYTQLLQTFDIKSGTYNDATERIHQIIPPDGVTEPSDINPDTICRCSGLKDDNGTLVFEGDNIHVYGGEYYHGIYEQNQHLTVPVGSFNEYAIDFVLGEYEHIEIINNIHD